MQSNYFKDIWKGKVVIVGVGNALRGDDAFGPTLIERLKGRVPAACVNAGSSPENYAGKIIKENPETIIIADAAHLGVPAGGYELLKKGDILKTGFSTHDMSPAMFIGYLENETKADVYLLAVQPGKIGLGEKMSPGVKKALRKITRLILEASGA